MAKRGPQDPNARRLKPAAENENATPEVAETTDPTQHSKLDPGLRMIAMTAATEMAELDSESAFSVAASTAAPPEVSLFVQFTGDISDIEKAGFQTRTVAGDVACGDIAVSQLAALEAIPSITRMEVSRVMNNELDLAAADVRVAPVHTGPPGHRGAGVIVGIIDSGIDYRHQSFRAPDGRSRILAIWDQGLSRVGTETSPAGFGYGVEYRQAQINTALAAANPLAIVRHQDSAGAQFHGTHVTGIAAGDGSVAGQGRPAFTFVGIAPEADIIVVANNRGRAAGERGLGDSADTLDAVRYIFNFAQSLGRPVVINQSQGDNVGPHDGTSLLERGLDNLLGGAGRAFVKSAGNEGARNRHASGTLTAGGVQTVQFNVPGGVPQVTIDLWYRGADRIGVAVTRPGGAATANVNPPASTTINLPGGNQLFIDSSLNDPGNADNRIFLTISRGTSAQVQSGNWSLTLRGNTISFGQWDAWIQRNSDSQFLAPFVNAARTISVPGTAREIITVGSYITRGAGVGAISSFSSLGPTRDGRPAPTLSAPGQTLFSANVTTAADQYQGMMGTSMAAPMVTGAVALMLQRRPTMTAEQIRNCLISSARSDANTGATPNNAWGAGKLDVQAAFACAAPEIRRTLLPPCTIRTLTPSCTLRTVAPPCNIQTLVASQCLPRTVTPPCVIQSVTAPCPIQTLVAPCNIQTVAPACGFQTQNPACFPTQTLSAGCGVLVPNPTVVVNPGTNPAVLTARPGQSEATETWQAATANADWTADWSTTALESAPADPPDEDGIMSFWYGNPGY
jgi:hypothetical protein